MDDEEEDMSRPISQLWGTPCRDIKYQDRAAQIAAGQALAAVTAPQSHGRSGVSALSCGLYRQPRVPFRGNAGLRSHFPARFEPMEDEGERQIEEEVEEGGAEEHGGVAEQPNGQAGVSAEAQIGRKLREIGDKFQQDHIELFMRHQRQNLPVWMRLSLALFGFLFPREAPLPRLRGAQR